jgi:hypothetical protein
VLAAGCRLHRQDLRAATARDRPTHLRELRLRGHLLRDERGLDAVEQPLEPPHELGLGDPQLGVRRWPVVVERQRDAVQLLEQLGGEPVLELAQRPLVHLGEPRAGVVVERSAADLVEQLLDHRPDPHDLRGLADHHGRVLLAVVLVELDGLR